MIWMVRITCIIDFHMWPLIRDGYYICWFLLVILYVTMTEIIREVKPQVNPLSYFTKL